MGLVFLQAWGASGWWLVQNQKDSLTDCQYSMLRLYDASKHIITFKSRLQSDGTAPTLSGRKPDYLYSRR